LEVGVVEVLNFAGVVVSHYDVWKDFFEIRP